MNIAFFTDTYKPTINGIVTSITLFAETLRAAGHRVYIFGPSAPGFSEDDYYPFRSLSFPPIEPDFRVGIPISTKLLRQIPSLDIDVVHCHSFGPMGMLGLSHALVRRLPNVMTYHSMYSDFTRLRIPAYFAGVHGLIDTFDKFFCNRFQRVTAPTPYIADYLKQIGIKPEVTILPTGIDLTHFRDLPHDRPPELAAIPPGAKIIGCACRMAVEKNIDFLLQVFAILKQSQPDLYFVLVGGGGHLPALRERASALGLDDRIVFTGPVSRERIPALIRMLDVFTYACQTDTQGMVIIEAMAAGRPLVVTDQKVYHPFVRNGENGFLLAPDEILYAKTILRLLADADLRRAFGRRSQAMAEQFAIGAQTEKLVALYRELAADR
jgi:glycosyltransferase involved in cell wall biosynthesis